MLFKPGFSNAFVVPGSSVAASVSQPWKVGVLIGFDVSHLTQMKQN